MISIPELPEVESVRVGLKRLITGETIKSVDVLWPRIVNQPEIGAFKNLLQDETFTDVRRRGKYLFFDLTHYTLVSHLRMEGKFRLTDRSQAIDKHDHILFHLNSEKDLRYNDVRKFGRMSLLEKHQEHTLSGIQKLGPEPFPDSLDYQNFYDKLMRHAKAIKSVLLDQTAVAGLGNIYCDEVLYLSKIHPAKASNSLTDEEVARLREAIFQVMDEAITSGGTTIRTYSNAFGEDGHFQDKLKVYGKNGSPCLRCGTTIEKTKIAQRGTHYCPYCQTL